VAVHPRGFSITKRSFWGLGKVLNVPFPSKTASGAGDDAETIYFPLQKGLRPVPKINNIFNCKSERIFHDKKD